VKAILAQGPENAPGMKFVYSNAGYTVAGAIAERVTNTAWEDLMRARLFRPLGMTSAGFGAMGTPGADPPDQPYQHRAGLFGRVVAIGPGPLADNPPAIAPAGRVHCALGDWAKYIAAHLRAGKGDGKTALLKPDTWDKLHTPPAGGDYAMGWLVTERPWGGGRVLTHAGSNTMNYAVAWLAPKRDFAVLAATNLGGNKAASACDEAAAALIGFVTA
jgi:CubicO group peptidase (beta-lactamase class C family)